MQAFHKADLCVLASGGLERFGTPVLETTAFETSAVTFH
jgi:hypothetical protein